METFRIHPAVGIARVGNSSEYVIAPETMAGAPISPGSTLTGGLPIRAGTEDEPVRSGDVRDSAGALKRHAARFRIFAYPETAEEVWPRGDGVEVNIGSVVGGRTVADIVWTVHVANKKANAFVLSESGLQGISGYTDGNLPPMRNPSIEHPDAPQPPDKIRVMNEPGRVFKLTIDPGPRVVAGANAAAVRFDRPTPAQYYDAEAGNVVTLPKYPKSFPADSFKQMDSPSGPIDTLGELITDAKGRLLVLGGFGKAAGWRIKGASPPLDNDVNNNQWFDDSADGPVSAVLVFSDGSRAEVQGAWVTATDPSFAPQILNVVSLWDDIYDCWVRDLALSPSLYDPAKGGYQQSYKPTFDDQLRPIFSSASLQQWVVNLSQRGMAAHTSLASITAADDPATTPLAGIAAIFRNPNDPSQQNNTSLMPLHLGDAGDSFLTLRKTQYFFLQRWNKGKANYLAGSGPPLGPGEFLDKATFVNCLGGRFSPGIDLTFVMRERAVYRQPWQAAGVGPFRVHAKTLAYATAKSPTKPLLTAGYVPRHVEADGLEPGDLGKFMALPWHTDYNSCATHPPSPNPPGNRTLFWSWPAQRPVAVYTADDVLWGSDDPPDGLPPWNETWQLGKQRWSVRGLGTDSPDAENWGRYQVRRDMLDNWNRIGVVMQATQVEPPAGKRPKARAGQPAQPSAADKKPVALPTAWYLEVQSQLRDTGKSPVVPFPNIATDLDPDPTVGLDPRDLFYKLFNVDEFPAVRADARLYVDAWLKWAEAFSNDRKSPADRRFFRYTEQAFQDRLEEIYQQLVDEAADFDPGADGQFTTYEQMCTYTIQWAPFNLVDGAWLRNVGGTGPMDEVQSLLYSVSMDERGDGVVSMNHCNIYRDLCHTIGYYPPPIESREFAYDPQFLDSAFTVPAFQLAISEFTEEYYPEIIGMTLQLEWEVVQLKQTRDSMIFTGLDPHFYIMHIGIDNAVNGHGQRAADAVRLYLQNMRETGGDQAVQRAWRRIWNGFVAFASIGNFGNDLLALVNAKPDLRKQMIAMIERKANFGSRNHQNHKVGESRIDEWFSNPPAFLDALKDHGYITPGDWPNSRMLGLMNFETGPMYRVFTDDEIQLWADYTNSLAHPEPPPTPQPIPPARAMAALVDQLRPIQQGTAGHVLNSMADERGMVHTIDWWFEQPTRALMAALASPVNGLISPGDPANSRFFMDLIAPTGPMGSVFGLPADPPNSGSCRDVVHAWILAECPLPDERPFTLRLGTPRSKRDRHPTGRIYGMGNVH
ncbi:MAG TPA: LodA/GoxA family CTQ-dependent oxidase [Allosphingosinicella sp.]|nr:LodA/GoxA family CTQ-dependent oxidase [Allosphingosinicella sp.]